MKDQYHGIAKSEELVSLGYSKLELKIITILSKYSVEAHSTPLSGGLRFDPLKKQPWKSTLVSLYSDIPQD